MITNKGCKRLRDLEKKVDSGSGGNNEFLYVHFYEREENEGIVYYCDKTYQEILTSEKPVIGICNFGVLSICSAGKYSIDIYRARPDGSTLFCEGFTIYPEAPVEEYYHAFLLGPDDAPIS